MSRSTDSAQMLCDTGQVSEPLWALKQKSKPCPMNLRGRVTVQGLEGQCCRQKVAQSPWRLWVEGPGVVVLVVEGPWAADSGCPPSTASDQLLRCPGHDPPLTGPRPVGGPGCQGFSSQAGPQLANLFLEPLFFGQEALPGRSGCSQKCRTTWCECCVGSSGPLSWGQWVVDPLTRKGLAACCQGH